MQTSAKPGFAFRSKTDGMVTDFEVKIETSAGSLDAFVELVAINARPQFMLCGSEFDFEALEALWSGPNFGGIVRTFALGGFAKWPC